MLILSLEVTLYSPANKADFQMNGFVPGLGFDNEAYGKSERVIQLCVVSLACL